MQGVIAQSGYISKLVQCSTYIDICSCSCFAPFLDQERDHLFIQFASTTSSRYRVIGIGKHAEAPTSHLSLCQLVDQTCSVQEVNIIIRRASREEEAAVSKPVHMADRGVVVACDILVPRAHVSFCIDRVVKRPVRYWCNRHLFGFCQYRSKSKSLRAYS